MVLSVDRDISYRFRAGGPITPLTGHNMAMPIANRSASEEDLPPVEGTELERSLLSMIDEDTESACHFLQFQLWTHSLKKCKLDKW